MNYPEIRQIPVVYLAVVGSREISGERIRILIEEFIQNHPAWPGIVVVSGGARGVDTEAINAANALNLDYEEYYAQWDKLGKAAGAIRNTQVANRCTELLAIVRDVTFLTTGTNDVVKKALKLGKNVYLRSSDLASFLPVHHD